MVTVASHLQLLINFPVIRFPDVAPVILQKLYEQIGGNRSSRHKFYPYNGLQDKTDGFIACSTLSFHTASI